MKFSLSNGSLFALAVILPFVQAQSKVGPITASVTYNITGLNPGAEVGGPLLIAGGLSGVVLTRTCLLLTRQAGKYYAPGNPNEQRVNFGAYEGKGVTTATNFKDYGIPSGSSIDPFLDVSAAGDLDLDIWWTVDYSSPCVGHYTCSGSIVYTYSFDSITC
ncbi:hypothetical protein ONZ45_g5183 [Pleurotus djamor]|nr:hypothetical protein ONZ45_g5183 [Pleurotus djamor]